MVRFLLATAVVTALATACSGSSRPNADGEPGADAEGQVRAAAEGMIELINARRYGDMFDLFALECLEGISRDQVAEDWKQFAEQIGDPNFRLEITRFEVDSVSADRAEVTSQVVAHTTARDIPMGGAEDPFFDVFIKQDGIWKSGDQSC